MTKNGWHSEMANYIRNTLGDQNHLISTSFAGAEFFQPFAGMDFIDVHRYNPEKDANHKRWNELSHIWNAGVNKPAIFGEVGAYLYSGELDKQNPITQHNTMWASAFSGGFGCGLNWWWKDTHDNGGVENYRGLAEFMRGVDFEWNDFRPFKKSSIFALTPHGFLAEDLLARTEVFYLKNQENTQAMGWVHNRKAYWAYAENLHPTIPAFGNECYYLVDSDNDPTNNNSVPMFCPDDDLDCQAPFQLTSLAPRALVLTLRPELLPTAYHIQWFNTATGLGIGSPEVVIAPPIGITQINVPDMNSADEFAFKLWRGDTFRSNEAAGVVADTLRVCYNADISTLIPSWEDDGHLYRVDGREVSESFVLNRLGIHIIGVMDRRGSFSYPIEVVPCGQDNVMAQRTVTDKLYTYDETALAEKVFMVYPNPASDRLMIEITGNIGAFDLEIADIVGAPVLRSSSPAGQRTSINVGHLSRGTYIISLFSNGVREYKKVILQ